MQREPNRETVDVVLLLALGAAIIWILPTLTLGDPDLIRLQATQFLLLAGAAIVIMTERHIEDSARARARRGAMVVRQPEAMQAPSAAGGLHEAPQWGSV